MENQNKQTNQAFKINYERLNPQQKEAVDTIEGPVMVMAGPGTGKTQVLATRVANILDKQDIDPQNILALTFTDAAAQNMRERIVSMIGTSGFYVSIMTFHGFASEVISNYPDKFPIERGSEPLSDLERYELFEDLINTSDLEVLKPLNSPLYYVKECISRISDLKREYITPEKFEHIVEGEEQLLSNEIDDLKKTARVKREKALAKQKELLLLYVKYTSEMSKRKRYDFDDMISFVVQAFEADEELLLDYQEKFQYVLVDEYQDTNAAQNRMVELLLSFHADQPNLFVVGDPHQSIYRFQGASTENMLQFVKRYPGTKVVTLETGYRCFQEVYNAAHDLIGNNVLEFSDKVLDKALSTKLDAFKKDGEGIKMFSAPSETVELFYICEEIQRLEKAGTPLDEISILYRNNVDAVKVQDAMEKWGIAYELSSGSNALDDILIEQLLNFFQVIDDVAKRRDSEKLFDVMQYQWLELNRVSVFRLAKIASKQYISIIEVLEKEYKDFQETYGLSKEDFEEIVAFKTKLQTWYSLSQNMLFSEWFSLVISKENIDQFLDDDTDKEESEKPSGFGFMEYVLSRPVKTDHLYAVNSVFGEIKKFVATNHLFSIADFLKNITLMRENGVSIKTEDLNIVSNRVALSTVHSAKGKEWQYVFLLGCVDKKWGNKRNRELIPLPDSILLSTDTSKKEKNEDERRLFYVGLTRASKQAIITWSKTKTDGKALLNSMFINEVDKYITEVNETETEELTSQSEKFLEKYIAANTETIDYSKEEKLFFAQLVSEFKLSVTAFNNYLKDPHEFMINSLLRAPRAKSPILSFGTAIHYALEQFYSNFTKTDKVMTKEKLFDLFDSALVREHLLESDYEDRKKHGIKVLDFYYENELRDPHKSLFLEKSFGGKMNKIILMDGDEKISLTGRVDRIEIVDKVSQTIRVIDYKTGKPKSENVINGKASIVDYSQRELALPETIRGRYQRQLVFYKLLSQLDKTFPYSVVQAEFDFVEPGGVHKDKRVVRRFTITDEAVEDLKKEIVAVMREIRELGFLDI